MPGLQFRDPFRHDYFDLDKLSENQCFQLGRDPHCDIWLPDPKVSRVHAQIQRKNEVYLFSDLGRNASRMNQKSVKTHMLSFGDQLEIGRYHLHFCKKPDYAHDLRSLQSETESLDGIELVGISDAFHAALAQCRLAAKTDLPVLIQGETGSGKELMAQYLHQQSLRSSFQLFSINCAALSPTLIESELFGHEKGAFTGANQVRKGLFETASKGSLFLDEIGEIPLQTQAKLLRVLEEFCIRRVGGSHEIKTNVRILAATNRNLLQEIKMGNFREDLFHRLNTFTIEVPSLRERLGDIPALTKHFFECAGFQKELSPKALAELEAYHWPGNVRELKNTLLRTAFMCQGDVIETVYFGPRESLSSSPQPENPQPQAKNLYPLNKDPLLNMEQTEEHLIKRHLDVNRWSRHKTAQTLGISRSTLFLKMKKYGYL